MECKQNNIEGISELADNLATQILGSKPKFLYRENIDPKILNEEIEQIKNSMGNTLKGKKEDIIKHIIEGKLSKFYEDNVLLDMNYVLNDDDSLKVGEYIKQIEKKIESEIKINDYLLWILGETKD